MIRPMAMIVVRGCHFLVVDSTSTTEHYSVLAAELSRYLSQLCSGSIVYIWPVVRSSISERQRSEAQGGAPVTD
jgi:hypothetical protein